MKQHTEAGSSHGSLSSYAAGFALSIVLTLGAYLAVTHPMFSRGEIIAGVVLFGALQLLVQLIFFLHLDRESSPRWNLTVLAFAFVIVGILMGGSIWIMNNLSSHLMPDQAIVKDEGITR